MRILGKMRRGRWWQRWWWIRGAHQREPDLLLLSYEHDEENGSGAGEQRVEGIGGETVRDERAHGINVGRAGSTNHSPSDLETHEALSPPRLFRGTERAPLLQPLYNHLYVISIYHEYHSRHSCNRRSFHSGPTLHPSIVRNNGQR